MRDIKFRAWNPDPKHPYPMVQNPLHRCDASSVLEKQAIYKDWILMQYTGLKDKNRKEIYEGDIICWVDEVAVEEIEGHLRYEPEGKFLEVKIPDFYFFTADTVSAEECEIIGNIYEHGYLLDNTGSCKISE